MNHEKLLAILERRVKDPAMMAFIRGVVNSRAEPFGLPRWRTPQDTPPEEWLYEVGMPIGNLTSQLFANIYLNELDQYCKHRLKIHYYIRYMDDVIILGQDKETLHRWKAAVETFLREELALDLNSKTSIRPVRQGVEFVGVRIWPTHMKLRKSTVRRIKREVRKISALYAAGDMTRQDFYRRIASIRGLLKHTESASLRWRLNEIYRAELEKAKQKQLRERHSMSHLQIIAELETVTEMQARVIKIMATRLAELGDTVTGRDEIAQADKAYRDAIGGDEWPDWAEQGGEDDGEPYHTGGA